MSSHLRHCPKHRKPLPCAHCALTARPLVGPGELAAAVYVVPTETTEPKRGVKPIGERAMTAAERKRRQREGPEREELIKRIKKRIKTSEHANIEAMRRALAQFHDTLDLKSADDLREIAKAYRIHDRKGRSSLEGHTGTIKVAGRFTDRIEQIDAAAQRDEHGSSGGTGMTAEVYESGEGEFQKLRMWTYVKDAWDYIPEYTEAMFDGDERDLGFDVKYDPDEVVENTLCCRVRGCNFRTAFWFDARKHVEQILIKAEKQIELIDRFKEVVESGAVGYDSALADAQKVFNEQYWSHHTWTRHKWEGEFSKKSNP
jgi:hypothetical protein